MEHNHILPKGFEAAGVAAGIKENGALDLALLVSLEPAVMAGTFTTNQIKAAPVKACMKRLAEEDVAYGVVINSGNANACTGEQGQKDTEKMAARLAKRLGVEASQIYVCSTGHIGDFLPMAKVEKGIDQAAGALSPAGGHIAAQAIMTTDTCMKTVQEMMVIDGQPVCITGLVKGAGMIEPNMATMLAFIMTDAAVEKRMLQAALESAVRQSFNRISVDGDKSTNDTVLCMANGVAGNDVLNIGHPQWIEFCETLNLLAFDLAMQVMRDAEGANKVVTVTVQGAANDQDAEMAVRSIANSLLVKTSWVKNDVGWGRVMDALGYAGAKLCEETIDISYNDFPAVIGGLASNTALETLQAVVALDAFSLLIDLHLGKGSATVYACDCTEEYIRINE